MTVPPFNSIFDRSALIILTDGPVVLHGHQTSREEVIVVGIYYQANGITSKDIFLADRPC